MRLQIGNKVKVLDDVLEGVIINIKGDEYQVETTDGFVMNFQENELVRVGKDQHEMSKYSDINNPLLQEKSSEKIKKQSLFKQTKKEVVMEVDLHINQLVESTRNMDNFDMLNLQLDTAKHKVEYAIKKRISKIVFIHGVGEGVLKSELVRLLDRYPVKYYDASYQQYGSGATEVYVFQNPN